MCIFFTYLFSSLSVFSPLIRLSKIFDLLVRRVRCCWFSDWSLAKQFFVLFAEVRDTCCFFYRFGYELCDRLLEEIFSFVRVRDDVLKLLLEMLKRGYYALHPLPVVLFHNLDTKFSYTIPKSLRNDFYELFSGSNKSVLKRVFIIILRLLHYFSIRH